MNLEYITDYVKSRVPDADKASIDLVKSRTSYKKFSKGDIIINYGEYDDAAYIIKSGYTANYTKLKDGSDFIRTIFTAPNEFGCLHCFVTKKKANTVVKAITNCEVFILKSTDLIFKGNLIITKLYVKVLENTFLLFQQRINDLAGLDSSERYVKLRKQIPNIDNILPQNQIANYLNITPVQLSRVRKKLFNS